MDRPKVDYDQLASRFDARYQAGYVWGIGDALREFAQPGARVLEAGCGTGRWLTEFPASIGLELSFQMLLRAKAKNLDVSLVQGSADALPFRAGSFDLVYVVHALHHFGNPQAFLGAASELLKPGGRLAIVAMDPREFRDRWFIYDYFEGAWDIDMARFPSRQQVRDWIGDARLVDLSERVVDRASATQTGTAILKDPFLAKDQLSQLALLSDDAYQRGVEKVRAAAERGAVFPVELETTLTVARKPATSGSHGSGQPGR